jgi:hypothetical protein
MATLPKQSVYPSSGRTQSDIYRDLARAAFQGISLGFSDELEAAVRAAYGQKSYDEIVKEVRSDISKFRETDPVKAYGAEILGSLLTTGGAAATVGRGLMKLGAGRVPTAAGLGAFEGGVYGAGAAEKMEDIPKEAAIGAGIGMIGGAAGEYMIPRATEAARSMLKRGYPLTPGQYFGGTVGSLEQKVSLPFAQETIQAARRKGVEMFSRETVENILKPLGINVPKNLEGEALVDFAQQAVSDSYQNIVPKLSITTRPVDEAIDEIIADRINAGQFVDVDVDGFEKILAGVYKRHTSNGKLSKQKLKDAESDITNEIRGLSRSSNSIERAYGKALTEVRDALREQIVKQNPDVPSLQRVNRAFAEMKPVTKASQAAIGAAGKFTPIQYLRQVKGVPSGMLTKQAAREARDVLATSVGDSGTAGREALSRMIENPLQATLGLPAALGLGTVYGTGLGRAFMRGPISPLKAPGYITRAGAPVAGGLLESEDLPRMDITLDDVRRATGLLQ